MFGCIVVALELATLTFAFWYIFLREEKPWKIIGDPWGNYDGVEDSAKDKVCGEIGLDRSGNVVVRSALSRDELTHEIRLFPDKN